MLFMVLVGIPFSCHSKSDALCNLFKNQMSSARNPSWRHSKSDALSHYLKSVRNNVNIIWYNSLTVWYPHPECILMLKGILMSKQVPAFLKVQLCGLEVLLAWVDALSLTKSCREGALWKFGLLIISYLQNGMHFLNCRNYFGLMVGRRI